MLLVLLVGYGLAQPKGLTERKAVDTVERYVRLRLSGAHWVAFAPLIGWQDEPGWDCNWLVTGYAVGTAEEADGGVVPVTYDRIGFYCHDYEFKPEIRKVTVRYQLPESAKGWKIKGPEPDPPDLSADVQIASLRAVARDRHEPAANRKRADAMRRQLSTYIRRAELSIEQQFSTVPVETRRYGLTGPQWKRRGVVNGDAT